MYLVICCCRRCCKVDQTKEFCTADRYLIKRLHFGSLERADINLGLNIKYAFRAFSFFIFIFRPETPKEYLRQKIVLTFQGGALQLGSVPAEHTFGARTFPLLAFVPRPDSLVFENSHGLPNYYYK